MQKKQRVIKVSRQSLESFAVYDSDFYDVTLLPLAASNNAVIKCESTRRFTLEDMDQVLEKIIENETEVAGFFFAWFEPFIYHFYEALELDCLYSEYPGAPQSYKLSFMPLSDNDLLRWMIAYIWDLFKELSASDIRLKAADYLNAEALLYMIDLHYEESALPVEQREYIDEIKEDFIREHDNDLILKESDSITKKLFVKYVNELIKNRNINALRIKGYALLGGNSVFRSDYKEGARLMEILWKEEGVGYAANTLGFIYYEGQLNGGRPDFEQAFKYFSIGHAFGINESTLKLSHMFMEGLFVSRNLSMAANLIERLYVDSRIKFEHEDYACFFAEAAVGMMKLQLQYMKDDPDASPLLKRQAADFGLQAEYALKSRLMIYPIASDNRLLQDVQKELAALTADMKIYKTSYTTDYPDILKDFYSYRPFGKYSLELKQLYNYKLKITINRLPEREGEKTSPSLLSYLGFCCADLCVKVSITANRADIEYIEKSAPFLFDELEIYRLNDGRSRLRFIYSGKNTAIITAKDFTIKRP